jgi:hypothetical protein
MIQIENLYNQIGGNIDSDNISMQDDNLIPVKVQKTSLIQKINPLTPVNDIELEELD